MRKIDPTVFHWLGEQLDPPPPPKPKKNRTKWVPRLNPSQLRAFNSCARYLLAYGEKGSGKTRGLLDKLVRHAYENQNALCLIVVKQMAMATKGGAWDELVQQVLPTWRDGNRDRDGNLLDEGMGLEFSDVKYDANHNPFVWVENRFGGWSMVTVMTAPHGHQLRARIRGYTPSCVLVDELTSCETRDYFTAISAQIGRKRGIDGPQQYMAACNPEGPSHWVYKVWWEEAFNEETGKWDDDYEKHHIPSHENRHNLPDGYIESLEKVYKSDPVEADRMLRGVWIDRPSGDSLFRDTFNIGIHVRPLKEDGNPDHKRGLMPIAGHPIIIGCDPGSVFNAFVLQQWLPPIPGVTPWQDEMGWLVFDEVCLFKRKVFYHQIIPILMRRVKWWREQCKVGAEKLPQVWISDTSALNQFRASAQTADSAYDVLEIERVYNAYRERYALEPIKIKPTPKFGGSKAVRVRGLSQNFAEQRIMISSRCQHVRSMALNLESEKQKPGEFDPDRAMTPKRSDHIHVFDALTYPHITASLEPSKLIGWSAEKTQQIGPIGS
jgi:hypothetical protein